jgi:hypothetical protein
MQIRAEFFERESCIKNSTETTQYRIDLDAVFHRLAARSEGNLDCR